MSAWSTDGLICPTPHEQITIDFLFRGSGSRLWNCAMQFQQNSAHSGPETDSFAIARLIEFESFDSAAGGIADKHADGDSGSCTKQRDTTGAEKDR